MPTDTGSILLIPPPGQSVIVERGCAILSRELWEHHGVRTRRDGATDRVIELRVERGIGKEGYRIGRREGGGVRIAGDDERGLLYGIGKFLRTSRLDTNGHLSGARLGAATPKKDIRGMYLATHFHNFFHDAPLDNVTRYVEDLALWGVNAFMVWYDMHHFAGFDDPAAVAHRHRLKAILNTASQLGLDTGLVVVANEGYGNSPACLRADPGGMRGSAIKSDICPMKEGGREYIMEGFAREFDWFAPVHPTFLAIWPYDSGGCGCAQCRPWGSRGFLRIAGPVAKLARERLPGVQIILSTWFFDRAEWNAFQQEPADGPAWFDFLLTEQFTNAPDDIADQAPPVFGKCAVGFPEISMWDMAPWGGFGANPFPQRLATLWRGRAPFLAGGFPYSEGIFEDINKVVQTQLYWDPDVLPEEILKEYIGYEYAPAVESEVLTVIGLLEQNHHREKIGPGAGEAFRLMQAAESRLGPRTRGSWRWRILYLRSLIDREILAHEGKLRGGTLQAAFDELTRIYHADRALEGWLRPPHVE